MKQASFKPAAVIAALALVAAGCGGGNDDNSSDDSSESTDDAPPEEAADDPSEEAPDEPAEEAADDPAEDADAEPADEPSGELAETSTEPAEVVGEGATVRINWGGFPENWLPGADYGRGYLRVPYENLVKLDDAGEVVPQLAVDWEQDDTGITFTLREGVTFHDGTPLTAEAVKASLEATAEAPTDLSGPVQVISSIDVVDDLTVQLNTAEPSPSLLLTLVSPSGFIYSADAIADGTLTDHPVGTGPWAYNADASSPGTRLNFDYFEDYWGGRDSVGFDTVELYDIQDGTAIAGALQNGEIDLSFYVPQQQEQLDNDPNLETMQYPAIRNGIMFFDRGPGGIFEDVTVRQALCAAMDSAVAAQVWPAAPQTQTFLEGEVGHIPDFDPFPHDLGRAQQLYAEAGSPTIQGETLATFFTEAQSVVFTEQMNELDGVDLEVQVAPPPQWFGVWDSGQYAYGLGSQPELHPSEWYLRYFAPDAAGNPSGTVSPELQAAAAAAIAAGVSSEADDLWTEVSRIVHEEALTCARMTAPENVAWNVQTVAGVEAPDQRYEPKLIDYSVLRPAE